MSVTFYVTSDDALSVNLANGNAGRILALIDVDIEEEGWVGELTSEQIALLRLVLADMVANGEQWQNKYQLVSYLCAFSRMEGALRMGLIDTVKYG